MGMADQMNAATLSVDITNIVAKGDSRFHQLYDKQLVVVRCAGYVHFMISFSVGPYIISPDAWHIGLALGLLVSLLLWRWRRRREVAQLREQEIDHEAALVALRASLEGELTMARMRLEVSQDSHEQDKTRLDGAIAQVRRDWDREKADWRKGWDDDKALLRQAVHRAEQAEQKLAAISAQAETRQAAFDKERESLKALTEDVQQKFQSLADSALRKSQGQFLELADQHLKKHKEGAEGQIKSLIKPMEESFTQFREKVDSIQKVSTEDRATMQEQFRQLMTNMQATQATTTKLANALSAPKGGGRWGEETLRNVLQMAGLSEHVDFTEQTHSQTDGGAIRPDVTINMPGGRQLVIDAKVSVEDFLRAAEETDPQRQGELLADHARKVRAHVSTLGRKAYWAELSDAVDFVAMFIPGEKFLRGGA